MNTTSKEKVLEPHEYYSVSNEPIISNNRAKQLFYSTCNTDNGPHPQFLSTDYDGDSSENLNWKKLERKNYMINSVNKINYKYAKKNGIRVYDSLHFDNSYTVSKFMNRPEPFHSKALKSYHSSYYSTTGPNFIKGSIGESHGAIIKTVEADMNLDEALVKYIANHLKISYDEALVIIYKCRGFNRHKFLTSLSIDFRNFLKEKYPNSKEYGVEMFRFRDFINWRHYEEQLNEIIKWYKEKLKAQNLLNVDDLFNRSIDGPKFTPFRRRHNLYERMKGDKEMKRPKFANATINTAKYRVSGFMNGIIDNAILATYNGLINKFGIPLKLDLVSNLGDEVKVIQSVLNTDYDEYGVPKLSQLRTTLIQEMAETYKKKSLPDSVLKLNSFKGFYLVNLNLTLRYLFRLDKKKMNKIVSLDTSSKIINDLFTNTDKMKSFNDFIEDKASESHANENELLVSNSFFIKKMGHGSTTTFLLVFNTYDEDEALYSDNKRKAVRLNMYFFGPGKDLYFDNFGKYCTQAYLYDFACRCLKDGSFTYLDQKESDMEKKTTFRFRKFVADKNHAEGDSYYIPIDESSKTFESIVLKDDKKNILKNTIKTFCSQRSMYSDFGISARFGIMLYGEPGTGKTTIGKAIAQYVDTLPDTSNTTIITLYPDISDNSWLSETQRFVEQANRDNDGQALFIFIIEDIDIILGANRSDERDINDRARLSDLFKFLDGNSMSVDSIIIATTNEYEKLKEKFDEALLREGRFDVKMHIGNFDREDASMMAKYFKVDLDGIEKTYDDISYPITPSKMQNFCTNYITNVIIKQNVEIQLEEED